MMKRFDLRRSLAPASGRLGQLGLALLVVGAPARAFADEGALPGVPAASVEVAPPPALSPSPPEPPKHWYGAETLVSDGISAALLAGGLLDSAGPYFIAASAIGYSLGAPIIHFAHRRPLEGFTSFVLRVPAPLLVGGGTALAYCSRVGGEFCGLAGLPPAITLVAVAVVVDAVFLSHEVVAARPRPVYAAAPLSITPTLAVTRRQAVLGVALTL